MNTKSVFFIKNGQSGRQLFHSIVNGELDYRSRGRQFESHLTHITFVAVEHEIILQ